MMTKIWASMIYKCQSCGFAKLMYLEMGVEGPEGQKQMPCPFCIRCSKCGELNMVHVAWELDNYFEPRELKEKESYFMVDEEARCGRPIHRGGGESD